MRYAITHITRFAYDSPVSESHMEVRMQPRTGNGQTCLRYDLHVEPRARPHAFHDYLSNRVDYFSVPGRHQSLTITARADVEVDGRPELPRSLDAAAWREVDDWSRHDAHWDLRKPSSFVAWTPALAAYAESIPTARARSADPLSTVREITSAVHRDFEYAPNSTRVNSTIDEALASRRGVCQDLSHITLALLRRLDLPARYVSGYLATAVERCGRRLDLERDTRLGRSAAAATGMGRVRSDKRHRGRRAARSGGDWTRLCGRTPRTRRLQGHGRQHTDRLG